MGIKKLVENLLITDIADKGQALGKSGPTVVFVDKAIPGDVVDVMITRSRKNYMEGRVTALKTPSELRATPFCSHFGLCGGCKWQDMQYPSQLHYKQKQVSDAMERIAKVNSLEILPIIAAPDTTYYRNKLEYTFSPKRWLTRDEMENPETVLPGFGFHMPGRFDKVLDIRHCYLQAEPSNSIRLSVKDFTMEKGYSYFDPVTQHGFLRNMIIRSSSSGEVMVIVVFHKYDKDKIDPLMDHIRESFPQVTSLLYVINEKKNDSVSDLPVTLYSGNPFITEKMEDLTFRIGAKSFYQTNATQAYRLYCVTREFAGLTGTETVYDLYTGTGTIANFVASKAGKVIGVEYIPEAIADAFENSEVNGITNTAFFAGDMKAILTQEFFDKHGKPDVIIADPPRAGMEEKVVQSILSSGAGTIVYVSCNPATQARDMLLLSPVYEAIRSQPVDMFPHTHHVENVVLLKRRS